MLSNNLHSGAAYVKGGIPIPFHRFVNALYSNGFYVTWTSFPNQSRKDENLDASAVKNSTCGSPNLVQMATGLHLSNVFRISRNDTHSPTCTNSCYIKSKITPEIPLLMVADAAAQDLKALQKSAVVDLKTTLVLIKLARERPHLWIRPFEKQPCASTLCTRLNPKPPHSIVTDFCPKQYCRQNRQLFSRWRTM